jgi:hypothetical protein
MKWFERLQKITGVDLPKLQHLIYFNVSVNIDKSVHYDESKKSLTVNPKKLREKEYRALQRVLPEVLGMFGAIIEEKSVPVVDSVRESLPSMESEADKLMRIIPPEDVPLLMSCLYLRKRFQSGVAVEGIKQQIMNVYGARGGKFANLVSAGYLESFFVPLYDQLSAASPNDPDTAKSNFRKSYNTIVNEQPWTEFISTRTTVEKATSHIIGKLMGNAESGVRFINIHGLGAQNVRKILRMLPEIEKKTGANRVHVERDAARIFVRLEIPVKRLGSSQPGA